jgi:hypothetical protein
MANSKFVLAFYIFLLSNNLYSRDWNCVDSIAKLDSIFVNKNTSWCDLSFGPSITSEQNGFGIFIFGPTFSFTNINKNYRLLKIKSSFHYAFSLWENFAQHTGELNLMTGKILVENKHSFEFYYGLGVITGLKHGKVLPSGAGGGWFSFSLTTRYSREIFTTAGVPIEIKIQWDRMGFGVDGNLNYYLPYAGVKWFFRLGKDYRLNNKVFNH